MFIIGLHPPLSTPAVRAPIGAVCFDWGGTLMVDDGPNGVPMGEWPVVKAVAGARECLEALHGRVPLCVATNAGQSDRKMIELALGRVDLLPYIDRVFCFTEIGATKDRPEFWSAVARGLDLPPAEIVMIGDSFVHDVRASRRQGFQAVWFNENGLIENSLMTSPTVTDLGPCSPPLDFTMRRARKGNAPTDLKAPQAYTAISTYQRSPLGSLLRSYPKTVLPSIETQRTHLVSSNAKPPKRRATIGRLMFPHRQQYQRPERKYIQATYFA